MDNTKVTTNLNAKFGGEHSVLRGGYGLSAGLDMHTTADIHRVGGETVRIELVNLKKDRTFTAQNLKDLYHEYSSRSKGPKSTGLEAYFKKHEMDAIGKEMLPFVTIASRLYSEFGINLIGTHTVISSNATVRSGFASSAASSAAFAIGQIKLAELKLDSQVIIDISKDGERSVHQKETAGRIDMGPATLGGFTLFDPSTGRTERLDLHNKLYLVASNVGDKPPTPDMIRQVDQEIERHPEKIEYMNAINPAVKIEIEALKRNDIVELGRQMDIIHSLLEKLGATRSYFDDGEAIPRLDRFRSIAKAAGALGVKMVGGGGGGGEIALAGNAHDADNIVNALMDAKCKEAARVEISFESAL